MFPVRPPSFRRGSPANDRPWVRPERLHPAGNLATPARSWTRKCSALPAWAICPGLDVDGGRSAPDEGRRWPICHPFGGVACRWIDHRVWRGIDGGRSSRVLGRGSAAEPGARASDRQRSRCIGRRLCATEDGGRSADVTRRCDVGGSAIVTGDSGQIDHRRTAAASAERDGEVSACQRGQRVTARGQRGGSRPTEIDDSRLARPNHSRFWTEFRVFLRNKGGGRPRFCQCGQASRRFSCVVRMRGRSFASEVRGREREGRSS
jgi:hypothetical protein